MHELSVAQSIVEVVERYVPTGRRSPGSVQSVKIKLGRLSGVVPESLEFCFGIVVEGTILDGADLDIEPVTATFECRQCGEAFADEAMAFSCSSCKSTSVKVISGTELQVVEIEMAEDSNLDDRAKTS